MSQPRYLTKSRYVTALECPTKLFYTGKEDYADQKFDDPFLLQLALGGFQVGELAKCYYPEGVEIETRNYDEAVAQTEELLKRDSVTIFEAAFRHGDLFVRADIVVKNGNDIQLIEVKSKSWSPGSSSFLGKRGGIDSNYRSKLDDLTFQRHVVKSAHPEYAITPYLMLVDKTAPCPTDGLHQKFRIVKTGDRRMCIRQSDLTEEDVSRKILTLVPADEICEMIAAEMDPHDGIRTFADHIAYLAESYAADRKIAPRPSSACASCEFQADAHERAAGVKSGLHECWAEAMGWSESQIDEPNVLSLWDCRSKDKLIDAGKIRLADLTEPDIGIKTDDAPGITRTERQWKQIEMARMPGATHWIDVEGLRERMKTFRFPLHFIDFETAAPAIPFRAGRRPYEAIAFQFSHHVVHEDGTVEHRGEFLQTAPGTFPNYDFLRALRDELMQDEGTIFRYAAHENSYLNFIWEQLQADDSVPDRDELCTFILAISKSKKDQLETWCGERNMIDMLEMVKRFYYHPAMRGSNSIKAVLPAVLSSSEYLQRKYSQPIYGSDSGIPSKNFKDWTWVVSKPGVVATDLLSEPGAIATSGLSETGAVATVLLSEPGAVATGLLSEPGAVAPGAVPIHNPISKIQNPSDPYTLLPKLFDGASDHDLNLLLSEDEDGAVREGGAAMAAYALLQYEEMSDYERTELERSLKRYCELDTLAMVMIYEAWREWI